MFPAAATGFATGFSLILAIGAQNAFVLRQGLIRKHVFWLCLLCAVSDAILIAAGVLGFAAIVKQWPLLPQFMRWGGAAFLLVYGAQRLWAAYEGRIPPATRGPIGGALGDASQPPPPSHGSTPMSTSTP